MGQETGITYRDKVYKAIYDLPKGGEIIFNKVVSPENRASFIGLVKEFINLEYDIMYGFVIEFSQTFDKLRKR